MVGVKMKIKRYFIILMNIFLLFLLFSVSSFAEETTNATASETVDAVFQWEVIDESEKTAKITSVNTDVTGELVVPEVIEGYTVAEISNNAFSSCTYITSAVIYSNIGDATVSGLFSGCTSLKKVVFNCDMSVIGSSFFYNCSELIDVSLPQNLKKINMNAFYGCSSLEVIDIPDSVTSIAGQVFVKCSSLKSFSYPDGVTSVGNNSFMDCTSLESVVLSPNTKSISTNVFRNCTSLTEINIPGKVASIGENTFYGCTKLSKITVDASNTDYSADDTGVLYNYDKSKLIYCPLNAVSDNYIVPDNTTTINASAFSGVSGIKNIVIGDSVTDIGEKAFYQSSIESLKLGKNALNVGSYAFAESNLLTVEVDAVIDAWSNAVFYMCMDLTKVILNGTNSIIPLAMFSRCSSLSDISINSDIITVKGSAFNKCLNLEYISLGEKVEYFGANSFYNCTSLKAFPVSSFTHTIEREAFYGCTAAEELIIPDSVTMLASSSFYGCSGIKELVIGTGITEIKSKTFEYCSGIGDIVVPGNIKTICESAFEYSYPSSVVLEEGVENVGNSAFFGEEFDSKNKLSNIVLPSSLKTIGYNAFSGHCAKSIIIPENVESIGYRAFNGSVDFDVYIYSYDCIYSTSACPFNRNAYLSSIDIYGYSGSTAEVYATDCPSLSGEYHTHVYYDMCADGGLHKPSEKCADITTCIYCLETISGHTDSDDDKICDDCGNSAELPSYTPDCSLSFSNGILTVSGTSIIDGDYEELLNEYSSVTETIVFNNGFVFVGENVFSDFSAVKFIFIPETMTVIGNNAFVDSSNIKSIVSFADELNIDGAFSSDSSFNLFNKAGSLISGTASLANINVLKHSFSNGILDFEGSLSSDLYDLFDVTTMFSLMYENILTLHFDHFEAVGFSVYSFDAEDYTPVDDSVFDNVDFTMYAFVNGEYTQISFNEMYLMSSEGYDGIFYLTTQTDDNIIHDDTQISIADRFNQAIERILSAIVRLFNKIFAFFSKLGR